jgi:hypothetical protein
MTLRPAHLASALFALLSSALAFAPGCGTAGGSPQCRSNCAAAEKCPHAAAMDCSQECADLDTLNAAAGCGDSYEALITCEAGLPNACDDSSCTTQVNDYQACATSYCMTSPTTPPPGCSHFGF